MQSQEQHEDWIRRHTSGETKKDQDEHFYPCDVGNQPHGKMRMPREDEWAYDEESEPPIQTPCIVEGTLVESTLFIPPLPLQTQRGRSPTRSPIRGIGQGLLMLLAALLTVLLLTPLQPAVMRLFVSLVPAAGATATITLVTDQVDLHRAYTLTAVPAGVVLSTASRRSTNIQARIEARLLATPTLTQQITVPTTGRGHQPALYAHGLVTI
jgi:hypothetical protein